MKGDGEARLHFETGLGSQYWKSIDTVNQEKSYYVSFLCKILVYQCP